MYFILKLCAVVVNSCVLSIEIKFTIAMKIGK